MTLRLATRGSALALAQARWCSDRISAANEEDVEIVVVQTVGDVSREPLHVIGGTGVFASAVRDAVADGRADFAVHSAKDLPTAPCEGLQVAAVPPREDARDVVIARDGLHLHELGAGAVVGTGSPRRAAFLRAMGLPFDVVSIRGNVDTRVGFVTNGELDAVILARAGLSRLGRCAEITETLDPLQMLPAAGQGVLALECRDEDSTTAEALRSLHDERTAACWKAERTVLAQLELGCSAPIAAYAELAEGDDGLEIYLRGGLAICDDTDVLRRSTTGALADAQRLGSELAATLRADSGVATDNARELAGDS